MKISKAKLRQIIKEELGTLGEEAEETALNSPREAGRQWAYDNLVEAVKAALGAGLQGQVIRDVVDDELSAEEPNWSGNENPMREQ
jgi:hypothetical protein|tara:strand:- start:6215 stop:6472 length:258 start_codon:yes stop_codon:yes gene_type:complete